MEFHPIFTQKLKEKIRRIELHLMKTLLLVTQYQECKLMTAEKDV